MRRLKSWIAAPVGLALAGLCALPAAAQTYTLRGIGGADVVFVWRSSAAHSEGLKLIRAGVLKTNPRLVARLLACLVPSGTHAIITDAGFATHDVVVTSGKDSGCHGNVAAEAVKR